MHLQHPVLCLEPLHNPFTSTPPPVSLWQPSASCTLVFSRHSHISIPLAISYSTCNSVFCMHSVFCMLVHILSHFSHHISCFTLYLTFHIWMLAWSAQLPTTFVTCLLSLQMIALLPTFTELWGIRNCYHNSTLLVSGLVVYPYFLPSSISRLTHSPFLIPCMVPSCYVVPGNLSSIWSEPWYNW